MPVSTLISSIINTQLRDNIKVYKTESVNETAEYIKKLYDKLNKDYDSFFKVEDGVISYSSTLKKDKKLNMTTSVWFISQLAMIPQVSTTIAEAINKRFLTLVILYKEYEKLEDEKEREKLLMDITYPIKNDKERRIGVKISTRIYKYFYGIE